MLQYIVRHTLRDYNASKIYYTIMYDTPNMTPFCCVTVFLEAFVYISFMEQAFKSFQLAWQALDMEGPCYPTLKK